MNLGTSLVGLHVSENREMDPNMNRICLIAQSAGGLHRLSVPTDLMDSTVQVMFIILL